ncbi:MAG: hemerythrin domain-containing protein [Ideonella sp.]|nr:hemerythrin domain-containing protein [Ideonella sp.]
MPSLVWSDELALNHTQIDATHQEFVALLTAAEEAVARSVEEGLVAYEALVEHTVGHFGQEDRWMTKTGFAPENCHNGQHHQVLSLLKEVIVYAKDKGDYGPLTRVLPELGPWFANHAQTMDAILASHLDAVGFDFDTETMARPPQPATEPEPGVSHCGDGVGNACSSHA